MLRVDKVRMSRIADFLQSEFKDVSGYEQIGFKIYQENAEKRRSVERWIENIINSSLDLAKIMLICMDMRIPDTYKEYFVNLQAKGVIPKEISEKLIGGVRLRNILAHEYIDVKWKYIEKFVRGEWKIFEEWLNIVKKFLEKNKGE